KRGDGMVELDQEAGEKLIKFKKKNESFYTEDGAFKHNEMARSLINEFNIIILESKIYYYDGKKYIKDESFLKKQMTNLIPIIKERQRNEVMHSIRYMADEKDHAPTNYIGLLNGIYDLENKKIIDHTPDLVFTNLINANYNPDATSEDVEDLFLRISEGDKKVIELLNEMVGYTIYRSNVLEKAFLLKGEAGSSKSTLLNTIAKYLGDENIESLSLSQLGERFYTGMLKGKLANIGDDIPYKTIGDTSVFKKLATGERLMGEQKGETPFQFRPFTKLIFSANRIPRMNDSSKALIDRFVIVPLEARIRGTDKQDPFFEDKVTTDEARSYLLNIAIESLEKLLDKRRFTIPHIVHEELKEFNVMNDPIKEWLDEYEEEGKDLHNVPVSSAYNDYKTFCEHNGFKYPVSNKRL